MQGYDVRLTPQFEAWLDVLHDRAARMRIVARLRQIQSGKLGDWKPVGGSLSELRVHAGPGYRLYFARRGRSLIVVLAGGDKSTQQRDIASAMKTLEDLEARR